MTLSDGIIGQTPLQPPKVLMKDGVWCVPASERPRGWEGMGLREPSRDARFEELDKLIAQEPPGPKYASKFGWLIDKVMALADGERLEIPLPDNEAGAPYANRISAVLDQTVRTRTIVWNVVQKFTEGMDCSGIVITRLEPKPLPSAKQVVLDAVKAGASTSRDIEAVTDIPRKSISAHLSSLKDSGQIELTGTRRYETNGIPANEYKPVQVGVAVPRPVTKWQWLADRLKPLKEKESIEIPIPDDEGPPAKYANKVRSALLMRKDIAETFWYVGQVLPRDGGTPGMLRVTRGEEREPGLHQQIMAERTVTKTETTKVTVSTPVKPLPPPVDTPPIVLVPIKKDPAWDPYISEAKTQIATAVTPPAPVLEPTKHRREFIAADPPEAAELLTLSVDSWRTRGVTNQESDEECSELVEHTLPRLADVVHRHREAKSKLEVAAVDFLRFWHESDGTDDEDDPYAGDILSELMPRIHKLFVAEMEESDKRAASKEEENREQANALRVEIDRLKGKA